MFQPSHHLSTYVVGPMYKFLRLLQMPSKTIIKKNIYIKKEKIRFMW